MTKKNKKNGLFHDSVSRTKSSSPPREPAPFVSSDDLLEAARQMFVCREELSNSDARHSPGDETHEAAIAKEATWTKQWHRSLQMSPKSIRVVSECARHRLNRAEKEILVVLILERLSLIGLGNRTCGDVIRLLDIRRGRTVDTLRYMSEYGRLFRSGLIYYDDPDDDISERSLVVDPSLVDSILSESNCARAGWQVNTEEELYDHLGRLTYALSKRSDAMEGVSKGYGTQAEVYKLSRKVGRLFTGFSQTIDLHPEWRINNLLKREKSKLFSIWSWPILLALTGKELGHLEPDNDLFKGAGLARTLCNSPNELKFHMKHLKPGQPLVEEGMIQPCGGQDNFVDDDEHALAEVEFELTEKSLGLLGIGKRLKKRSSDIEIREARVRMDQLVLTEKVRSALAMAAAQTRNADVLVGDWGLEDVIPYGRSVALMFAGPPGTGKTACAEALAAELGKPLLVADYSKIQNCFVGQTEKNIVKIFRQAKANDALLFWDEADAMFFDRDAAMRSWEVRDVNVLLQELERFDGVCVLATNRKTSLDKALERRIGIRVEFDRPDLAMRHRIWEKLLPAKMPLAHDVDLEKLSEEELSGGEIKNAVLNAARIALVRGTKGPVTQADFEKAIRMDGESRWGRIDGQVAGFVN